VEVVWAQLDHVPVGPNDLLVRHEDNNHTTTLMNNAGPDLTWEALFPGVHPVVHIDGSPKSASTKLLNGAVVSSVTIQVKTGQRRTATTVPAKN
jgi:hypothetical protein